MTSSPCTKVCKIKEGVCTGCHRTLEQIGAWGSMTDKERQEEMRELKWPGPELPPINLWNAPRGEE
jgi:predicted Fe-S protein YdhL (DUF1289 family)